MKGFKTGFFFNISIMKASFYVLLLLTVLLAANCIIFYKVQMSLAGYHSDIILFWSWLLTSLFVIVVYWRKMLAKIFLGFLVLIVLGSVLMLGIPLYTLTLSMTSAGVHLKKDLNEKYRAQIVGYDPTSHPWLEVIEKQGLLEQVIYKTKEMDIELLKKQNINVKLDAQLRPELKISQAKNIILEKETDSTFAITLFYGGPNKTLTFDKASKRLLSVTKR